MQRYRIQFPPTNVRELGQDEVYFFLVDRDGEKIKIRLHDYDLLYRQPGLYEQVVYDRLRCQSPERVAQVLEYAVSQSAENVSELRVLDLGAGNGIMGEQCKKKGVSRLIGVDIISEAKVAAERDRPGTYDEYYVMDLCELDNEQREELSSWSCNCLVCVAALGFGDIPPQVFMEGFNLISAEGWIAFNIKETFLQSADHSGFAHLIRELINSNYIELFHMQRYRHRLSLEGKPLYYFAIGARKKADIPQTLFDSIVRED